MRFVLLLFLAGCGSAGGSGDVDADSDVDTDVDADTDSDTDSDCERPCDCIDCAGHGTCVNVAGGTACQCDDGWLQAEGPTCIPTSIDDPDAYCAKNPIRCVTHEWTALTDDCGSDECVVPWTQTFDLVAEMWLYRITSAGTGATGCDCAEDIPVQWLVDRECVAGGDGLAGEFVYAQAGLPETSFDVARALGIGTHSMRAFRGDGCGRLEVDFVRLELSPTNP